MSRSIPALLVLCVLLGCGAPSEPTPEADSASAGTPASARPAVLETPYTAEQIRDAWVEGLALRMENETRFGKQYQRWTVVSADGEGADIEYLEIDADGKPIGPPQVRRSLWVELRDHARFPADACTRTEETRQTPLGEHDGWVYTLRDDANKVVTEFFFAHDLPGAPVSMVVRQDGQVIQEMIQAARTTPES